jgi:hypothetical protein
LLNFKELFIGKLHQTSKIQDDLTYGQKTHPSGEIIMCKKIEL